MRLTSQPPPRPPEDPGKLRELWQTLTSGELLQASLHLSPSAISDAVQTSRDLGKSLGQSWRDVKDRLRELLHLPEVQRHIDPEQARAISRLTLTAASVLGYAATGVQAVAGASKLYSGIKENNRLKRLDGYLDLAMAGAIGTTIAGAGVAPLVLVPLAATLGLVRGGVHAVAGYRSGNVRNEVQGMLDGTRSLAILGSMMGHTAPALATLGAILGPVAGAIQASRGFIDLRDGLQQATPARQLQGLSDIGAALGLVLAATGVGTIPGIVLTALSVGARVLYPLNERFAGRCDQLLKKAEPGLRKAVGAVEGVWNPVLAAVRPWLDKLLKPPPSP
jgi:hypothetical protein